MESLVVSKPPVFTGIFQTANKKGGSGCRERKKKDPHISDFPFFLSAWLKEVENLSAANHIFAALGFGR